MPPDTRRKGAARAELGPEAEHLGKTVRRLREAYQLSLGQLSEQSGVAKSIIAAIEKNETNPTIGTLYRLSRALNRPVEDILKESAESKPLIERARRAAIPILESEDGLCRLEILGPLTTVDTVQWYLFRAEPGGRLESDPHPAGSIENLSVVEGRLEVTVDDQATDVSAGETLRYAGDRRHAIANRSETAALAFMVNLLPPLAA